MSRGLQRERDLVNRLRTEGWWALRSPASKGTVDVVAIKTPLVRFVEVKSTQAGPYSHFGPAEREALSLEAKQAGAEAWLVWWPKHKQPQWIAEKDWP